MPRVYIVILNWNGWKDTVTCLESVLRLDYTNYQIIVCDNASSDDSIANIRKWAEGSLQLDISRTPLGYALDFPIAKPVTLVEYDRSASEIIGTQSLGQGRLILIHTGANLGFAGGNNVGIRFSMARDDVDYIWLLNNDTVVDPNALSELVDRASKSRLIGIVGSTLCFFDAPTTVQSYGGGTFNVNRAMTCHIGEGEKLRVLSENQVNLIEAQMAYVVGASMLVSKQFIECIGMMQEDYFLYFEEIDWAERSRRNSIQFHLALAPRSIVYHKVGASVGTRRKSLLSMRYLTVNRLRFIKRFYPGKLIFARFSVLWEGIKSLLKGRLSLANISIQAALSPVKL
jgi:GT2 family glycosyltransferase